MANIIGNLPVNLANGTEADASQVMTDLNYIVNQVNANGMAANTTSLPLVTEIGPSNGLTIDGSGNVTAAANLTINSDERLKKDWGTLADDFIERLAAVTSGTYTRIDTGQRQAGVGAQSLQAVLPEAVQESESHILSVAYGQAALVACIELAKEVMRLRALLGQSK